MTLPLQVWLEADGRLLRLRLARPKANLVDAAMIAALDAALAAHLERPVLSAVLLDAEGPNFSFGASVEEHLPGACAAMLGSLHGLLGRMLESPVPILVAVHGRCLGGGLELALAGHLLFVTPAAELGQPEIRLGVFAPAASCLLPELIGPQRAFDLLVSGRSISGSEAASLGLAAAATADPQQAALEYFEQHLQPKSAQSLRYAVRAARQGLAVRVRTRLAAVERLYLDELMLSHDAVEGLSAFIDKRPAKWEHH
ncbi:MAG TPA: cyclohexa-1,5-dienecarbonyl-CoA hydratase [Steroidobacteraceae bacterium]|nr:cyclohexa-1,5-dienecarbonyl-CoA hydratase [Steroidobacteraceae bacterium]